jgi:hypothetical protein
MGSDNIKPVKELKQSEHSKHCEDWDYYTLEKERFV